LPPERGWCSVAEGRESGWRISTRAVRSGWSPDRDPAREPVVPPIYVSAIYKHPPGTEHIFPRVGDLKYSRENNPTVMGLEEALAAVESARWALAFNSGMAAIAAILHTEAVRARRITVMRLVYAPTRLLAERLSKLMGLELRLAGPPWEDLLEAASESDVVIVESMANPTLRVPPLRELYSICRERGCAVVVDNTFASPVIYRPLEDGAHAVVESMTKYMAGHNDVLGGLVALRDRRVYEESWHWRRLLGGIMQPLDAYLVMRGVKTLGVRVERASKTAMEIAEWLEDHPRVERVYYPGLESHPDYEEARRLFNGLYGGVVSFEVRGGQEAALRVMERLRIISPSPSLGGVESLISYPAWASHGGLPEKERLELGITPGLLRLSVGLEDPQDLIEDLDNALSSI